MAVVNTLAYYDTATITAVKSSTVQAPRLYQEVCKLELLKALIISV